MADDEDRPQHRPTHEIGGLLDALSIRDFDERIAMLEAEISRLQIAKAAKEMALDRAGSVFKSG